ncbi:MAG: DUF4340 domain-containing protein [Spirochaetota bacterium]|jgi:hypothetical protein|nr:DUF4340 domain-containing protein [Spirochaetota bacterium]
MPQRKFPVLPVMGGLFLVLAVYVIVIEIPRDQKESAPQTALIVPNFAPGEVTKIEYVGSESYTLAKATNGEWVFTAPRPYRVEQSAILPLLDDFASLEAAQTLKNMEPRLEQYGLQPPQAALIMESGNMRWHLSFGLESLAQFGENESAQSYVFVDGSPPVYLAESFKLNRLRKPIADYRYRRVLDLDLQGLQMVETRFEGRIFRLIREKETWFLEKGELRKLVNPQQLLPLLGELYEFAVDDFISDYAASAQYGIYPASDYVRVEDGQGTRTLSFGRNDEGKVYCAFAPYGEIYSVLEDKIKRLDTETSDFMADAPAEDSDIPKDAPVP